jgi:hypothetical protein
MHMDPKELEFGFDKFMVEIVENEDKKQLVDEVEPRPAHKYNRRYRELPQTHRTRHEK